MGALAQGGVNPLLEARTVPAGLSRQVPRRRRRSSYSTAGWGRRMSRIPRRTRANGRSRRRAWPTQHYRMCTRDRSWAVCWDAADSQGDVLACRGYATSSPIGGRRPVLTRLRSRRRSALQVGRSIEWMGHRKEAHYPRLARADGGETVRDPGGHNYRVVRPYSAHLVSQTHLQRPFKDNDELVVLVKVQGRSGAVSEDGVGKGAGDAVLGTGKVPLSIVGPPGRLWDRAVINDRHGWHSFGSGAYGLQARRWKSISQRQPRNYFFVPFPAPPGRRYSHQRSRTFHVACVKGGRPSRVVPSSAEGWRPRTS